MERLDRRCLSQLAPDDDDDDDDLDPDCWKYIIVLFNICIPILGYLREPTAFNNNDNTITTTP